MMSPVNACPGCKVRLPVAAGSADDRLRGYHASPECLALFDELSARTLSEHDPAFPHQLAVDAYAAQHAGPAAKPITTAFALIGLYLVCERGATGRQAQLAHMALARRRRDWPRFEPPANRGDVTVADVLAAVGQEPLSEALRRWAASVWRAWEPSQPRVAALIRERLDERDAHRIGISPRHLA